jgi:hypothetical protein
VGEFPMAPLLKMTLCGFPPAHVQVTVVAVDTVVALGEKKLSSTEI